MYPTNFILLAINLRKEHLWNTEQLFIQDVSNHFLDQDAAHLLIFRAYSISFLSSLFTQVLEEKLIPVTIFWIFSSFFRMLDFTAQILSWWSLISSSNSPSSALRGSTARSVVLRRREHTEQHTLHITYRSQKLFFKDQQVTQQLVCALSEKIRKKTIT